MNTRDVVRRLKAYHAGRPLPRGDTLHLAVADAPDLLIVAFVRMGGESRPWGIAFGHPGEAPQVFAVPEARNRDLVADMAARFAPVLLSHLRAPGHAPDTPTGPQDLRPLRQVWLPNASHLDMLHHLAYAYTFARHGANAVLLNALGRACGWLFREAQRPGTLAVQVATQALRSSYTFPAEDVRQGHLGFLLAWLDTRGRLPRRLAAAMDAERRSMSISLDPDLERDVLEPLVDAWRQAERDTKPRLRQWKAREIEDALSKALLHRWTLAERAVSILRADRRRPNAGLAELGDATVAEQWWQYAGPEEKLSRGEHAFVPSPETDRYAAGAAARYFTYAASADRVTARLVHDDGELLAEAIADGDAFQGGILQVRDERRGAKRPVWLVADRADRQLRLRTGTEVCVVGVPRRTARIRRFLTTRAGVPAIEVELRNKKTRDSSLPGAQGLAPTAPDLEGQVVAFVSSPIAGIPERKARRVWKSDGPGAWLTHAAPEGVAPRADGDDATGAAP